MKESVLSHIAVCSKCGERYYKYRGVSDSRGESCFDDFDIKREDKPVNNHETQTQTGS